MTSRSGAATVLCLALLGASLGCEGGEPEDAGIDASSDAGRDAAGSSRRDAAPPLCAPACEPDRSCCDVAGTNLCLDLRTDPEHCGSCTVNCLSEHRGDSCAASTCVCGTSPLGCSGMREDHCCPPRTSGGAAYCANLERSGSDCGACGRSCDPRRADHCDGGECRCGPLRTQCDGTPESRCCAVGADVGCVDTTRDTFHCGACGNLCRAGERCLDSTCTTGPACPGGCAPGEVCCDGACCSRRSCQAGGGTCAPEPDGGPGDAGAPDAG